MSKIRIATKGSIRRQLVLLTISFLFVFALSLALIWQERRQTKDQEAAASQSQGGAVQGVKIGQTYVDYRDNARAAILDVDSILAGYEAAGAIETKAADNLYEFLLGVSVPGAYKELHLRLTRLLISLRGNDAAAALDQRFRLVQDHPWLVESADLAND